MLPDGRLVSWGGEESGTLTVWDEWLTSRLSTFKVGGWIQEVSTVKDGRFIVVQYDDDGCGERFELCFDSFTGERGYCEAADIVENAFSPRLAIGGIRAEVAASRAVLASVADGKSLAQWHSDLNVIAQCLLPDGTLLVSLAAGGLCFLKLHRSNRRVTLDGKYLDGPDEP